VEAERILKEDQAAQLLDLAKTMIRGNPEAARRRMQELVRKFADTKAAEEAKRLLGQAE
jgi:hypothetical protein